MPIRAENRWLYPIDWTQLSRTIRFDRAGARCERCRRPHRRRIAHLGDGRWWDGEARLWRSDHGRRAAVRDAAMLERVRTTYVVLACAHLDHDPGNNTPANLAGIVQHVAALVERLPPARHPRPVRGPAAHPPADAARTTDTSRCRHVGKAILAAGQRRSSPGR